MINPERVLQTFLELVRIDSPTGHEEVIGRHLSAQLEHLGLQVQIDAAGNLIARLPQDGADDNWLLLSAHMDTAGDGMGIRPLVRDGIVTSDGTTILGADDKSGVAVILEVLQKLRERGTAHPPLEVVFSTGEEQGLVGARQLDLSQLRARRGVVLDSGGEVGNIVVAGPTEIMFTAVIHGRKAHAAAEPEKGIHAIRVAAEAITAMSFGRIDEETTANIGMIKGGIATNVVPDEVTVDGEVRSHDVDKLARQVDAMKSAFDEAGDKYGARIEWRMERAYQGFRLPEDAPIIQRVVGAVEAIGKTPNLKPTAGGSDANVFNAGGLQCTNISTGMMKVHTAEEYIAVADLVDAARWLWHIVTD